MLRHPIDEPLLFVRGLLADRPVVRTLQVVVARRLGTPALVLYHTSRTILAFLLRGRVARAKLVVARSPRGIAAYTGYRGRPRDKWCLLVAVFGLQVDELRFSVDSGR